MVESDDYFLIHLLDIFKACNCAKYEYAQKLLSVLSATTSAAAFAASGVIGQSSLSLAGPSSVAIVAATTFFNSLCAISLPQNSAALNWSSGSAATSTSLLSSTMTTSSVHALPELMKFPIYEQQHWNAIYCTSRQLRDATLSSYEQTSIEWSNLYTRLSMRESAVSGKHANSHSFLVSHSQHTIGINPRFPMLNSLHNVDLMPLSLQNSIPQDQNHPHVNSPRFQNVTDLGGNANKYAPLLSILSVLPLYFHARMITIPIYYSICSDTIPERKFRFSIGIYKDLIERLEKLRRQFSTLLESQSFIMPVHDMFYALLLEVQLLLAYIKSAICIDLVQYKDAMLALMNSKSLLSTLSALMGSKWEKLKRLKKKEPTQVQQQNGNPSGAPNANVSIGSHQMNIPVASKDESPILLRLLTEYHHFLYGKASLFFYCPLANVSPILHQNINVAMKRLRYDFFGDVERLCTQFGLSNILCIFDGSEFSEIYGNMKEIATLSFPSIHGYKCPEPNKSAVFPSGLASYSVFFAYPSTSSDAFTQQFWTTISLITELQRYPTRSNCKYEIYDRSTSIANILISPPITQSFSDDDKYLSNAPLSAKKHRKFSSGDLKPLSTVSSFPASGSTVDRGRNVLTKERLVRFVVGRITEYVFLQFTVPLISTLSASEQTRRLHLLQMDIDKFCARLRGYGMFSD